MPGRTLNLLTLTSAKDLLSGDKVLFLKMSTSKDLKNIKEMFASSGVALALALKGLSQISGIKS